MDRNYIEKCDDCGYEVLSKYIKRWIYEKSVKLCENCYEERLKTDELEGN